jgi:hypothetical protein
MIILESKIYEEKIKNETTKNGGVNNSKWLSNDNNIHTLKIKNYDEIHKLPSEILTIIKEYIILYLQPFRKKLNIIKSNLPKDELIEYNFYEQKGIEVDYYKYNIGDKIIESPKAKWGWKERETHIRCYCPNCKDINPDKTIKLKVNYFQNKSYYKCYQCSNGGPRYTMYEGVSPNEVLSSRICINCFKSFNIYHFINGEHIYDENIICSDCTDFEIIIKSYCYMLLKYNIYLICKYCEKKSPKLCSRHHKKKILYKYDKLFKECSNCEKYTPQKCLNHKYYFYN